MKAVKFSPINGNNIGDLAISDSICFLFRKHNVEVISYDILFREPRSYQFEKATTLYKNKLSGFLQYKTPKFFSLLKALVFWANRDLQNFKNSIASFDFVIFGGGNLIMSKMGSDYGLRIARFSRSTSKPVVLFAVGVGPFLSAKRKILDSVIATSCYFSVRDSNSAIYFDGYREDSKPFLSIDPAFVISEIYPAANTGYKSFIGVNIISNYFSDSELQSLAHNIANLAKKKALAVKVVTTAFPADAHEAQKFVDFLTVNSSFSGVVKRFNLNQDLSNLSACYQDIKYFIGCRMHSIVFALSYGIPSLAFNWDPKVKSMLQRFMGSDFKSDIIINVQADLYPLFEQLEPINYKGLLEDAQQNIESDVLSAIDAVTMKLRK